MIEQIDLHIGDCRTGTTALQSALVTGGVRGAIYPGRGLNHNEFARAILDNVPSKASAMLKDFATEARAKGVRRLVLSAEHLEFSNPEDVRQALVSECPDAAIVVHMLVRTHADAVLSRYAEHIKLGDALGPLRKFSERMIDRRRLHYPERLERWGLVLGSGFKPAVFDEHAPQTLLQNLGGEAKAMPVKNARLFIEELAYLRWTHLRLKELGVKRGERGRFGRILAHGLRTREARSGTDIYLPTGIAQLMHETFGHDAAALDQTWFEGNRFTSGLANAARGAIDRPLQLRADLYFSQDQLALADGMARDMSEMPHGASRDDILEVLAIPK